MTMPARIHSIFRLMACGLTLLLACAACQTSRKATAGRPADENTRLPSESDMRVELRTLISSYGRWERVKVPVSLRLRQPKNISIGGTLVMECDKSIHLSLRYFGFEIGMLNLTADSILVVDKVNKRYAAERIAAFLGGADVTIENAQNVLLGRVFALGEKRLGTESFRNAEMEAVSSGSWLLHPRARLNGVDYGFLFSPLDILNALMIQTAGHEPVEITYSLPTSTVHGPVCGAVNVKYPSGKIPIDASIEMNTDKLRWDSEVEIPRVALSPKYQKIEATQIAKMISNL